MIDDLIRNKVGIFPYTAPVKLCSNITTHINIEYVYLFLQQIFFDSFIFFAGSMPRAALHGTQTVICPRYQYKS